MAFTLNPFTGSFDVFINGKIPEVITQADLPPASSNAGKTIQVLNNTGIWPYTLGFGTQKGYFRSNGTNWIKVELSAEIIQAQIDSASTIDRNRSNHTGTQPISTIDNLQTELDTKAPISHTHVAADISFDPASTSLSSTTAQAALEEIQNNIAGGVPDGSIVYDAEGNEGYYYYWDSPVYTAGTTDQLEIVDYTKNGSLRGVNDTQFNNASGPIPGNYALIASRAVAALQGGSPSVTISNATFEEIDAGAGNIQWRLRFALPTNFVYPDGFFGLRTETNGVQDDFADILAEGVSGLPAKVYHKETILGVTTWYDVYSNPEIRDVVSEPDLTGYDVINVYNRNDVTDVGDVRVGDNISLLVNDAGYQTSANVAASIAAIPPIDSTIVYRAKEQGYALLRSQYLFSLNSTQSVNILRATVNGSQKNITSTQVFTSGSFNQSGATLAGTRLINAMAIGTNAVDVSQVDIYFSQDINDNIFVDYRVPQGSPAIGNLTTGFLRGASYQNVIASFQGTFDGPTRRLLKKTYNASITWFELDDQDNQTPIAAPDLSTFFSVEVESFAKNDEMIRDKISDSQVIVKSAADLVDIDSSKVYIIDGKIDMGTQQIEVPVGGFFCKGLDYFVSSLYSNEDNYTMFINKAGEACGNIRVSNIEFYLTGTSSKLFDLDNQGNLGVIEFNSTNFGRFASEMPDLGSLSNFRQFRTSGVAFIRVAQGVEFIGTWAGGMLIDDTICLSLPDGSSLFKAGAGLIFQGSVKATINALSISATSSIFDFSPVNISLDRGFNLQAARFPDVSTAVPNMTVGSTKRYIQDCRGVANTFIGGGYEFTTAATTIINTISTPVKIAGTTTYNNLVHFTGADNNAITHASTVDSEFRVEGNMIIDGSPNNQLTLLVRRFNAATSDYTTVDTFQRSVTNSVGGADVATIPFASNVSLKVNDRIELWIQNNTNTNNVTAQVGSYVKVDER